jgi:hypothetical protein
LFDPAAYLALYGDVARDGMEPLTHYVAHGMAEGRVVPGASGDMARLLRTAAPDLPVADWPPAPVDGYWLPQTLRDVVISGHGEGAVGLYWYLCSLMERWRGREGFADSQDCADLVARMRGVPAGSPRSASSCRCITICSIRCCVWPVFWNVAGRGLRSLWPMMPPPMRRRAWLARSAGWCGICVRGQSGVPAQLQRRGGGGAGAAGGVAQQ